MKSIDQTRRNKRFTIYFSKQTKEACFEHDMVYEDFKDLTRRTASDKIYRDKALNIAKNPKYGYQGGLASMVYNFFDKKFFWQQY